MIRFKPHGVIASIFVASLLLFAALFLRFPVLYDGDSYFHLAAARLYAEGIPAGLEWARFSVMREGWGDKEILFHLFLLPFTMLPDPAVGGRLALAGLNAALLTLLSGLGWRTIGRWGLLIGPMTYLLQPDFLNRAFRLRPELLGVTLLIAMIVLAARRSYLGAALVACAWTLGYTAAQVPAGLALLWVAWERFERGVWNTRLALAVPGGVALGLLVHPHFPKNLEIWWIQNVRFFEFKSRLDVGEEIFAPGLAGIVLSNAAIVLVLGSLWL
ncbi:MAG TPA: hypothetical protein VLD39_17625, partial [Gammaproteobacteria bacterium]|nr:hypothetical protein [Gammaproteobacteria bacterium]